MLDPKPSHPLVDESLTLGIGISSCGPALIHQSEKEKPVIHSFSKMPDRISFVGVRTFDVPETKPKTEPKLKNPERRRAHCFMSGHGCP